MIAFGVTGTDTGVGKTVVACALAAAASRSGAQVGVMKPIETGVSSPSAATDAAALARAARTSDARELIAPYTFRGAVAPMVAARQASAEIDLRHLDDAFETIKRGRDVVVVEGAGGLLVPITHEVAFDALFSKWRLSLIVVAPNRLGVINHVRLTLQAAAAARLTVRAVVLNYVEGGGFDPSSESNGPTLRELLPKVCIVHFPRVRDVSDLDALADAAAQSGLVSLLDPRGHE